MIQPWGLWGPVVQVRQDKESHCCALSKQLRREATKIHPQQWPHSYVAIVFGSKASKTLLDARGDAE
jgi:hypothetical protein